MQAWNPRQPIYNLGSRSRGSRALGYVVRSEKITTERPRALAFISVPQQPDTCGRKQSLLCCGTVDVVGPTN